jgi:hypothetical protein
VLYDTYVYSWSHYLAGGAPWNVWSDDTTPVSGEGLQSDYWSLLGLIDTGVATPVSKITQSYC